MNRRNLILSLASFFLPVGVTLIVFARVGIYPFGELTFMRIDMALQYSSFLSSLKEILSGNNDLFYSFSLNGGGNFFFLNAYYLANPINYLMVLFPLEELPNALSWLILLRIGLCGLTSGLYLRKIGKNKAVSLLFSTSYALMTYNMVNAENYFFIDGVIFLPLVLIGIENIFQKQKISSYVIALALTLMIQFYIGYMICIFSCIYFLFRWYQENANRSQKTDWGKFGRFILGSLLAGGIAAFVLLPVAKGLAGSPKTSNPDLLTSQPNFQFFDLLSKNVLGAYDSNEYKVGLPGIYCGTFMNILIILYFLNPRITGRDKRLTGTVFMFLWLSFYIFGLNVIWHGLAEPAWWPYRYSFVFSFWMIRTAWLGYQKLDGLRKYHFLLAAILGLLPIVYTFVYPKPYNQTGEIISECIFSLLLVFFLFLTTTHFNKVRVVSQVIIAGIAITSLGANTAKILRTNISESLPTAEYREHVIKSEHLINNIKQQDPEFYRTESLVMRNYNDPLMFDYYGLSHYSSTANMHALKTLENLGIQQLWYWTRYSIGVPVGTDSLFGIRYLILENNAENKPYSTIFSESDYIVSKNLFALPIGMVVPQKIIRQIDQLDNPYESLNQIFHNLTEADYGNIYRPIETTKTIEKDGTQVWEINIDTTDALYMYRFDALNNPDEIKCNQNIVPLIKEDFYHNSYRLGSFKEGDLLQIKAPKGADIPDDLKRLFYSENLEALGQYSESIQKNAIRLKKVSSSYLQGDYTSTKDDNYLFFSIPYDVGWQSWIDGKEQLVIPSENGMMIVKANRGSHVIELKYTPPGFKTGAIISAISLLIFILLSVFRNKKTIRIIDKGFENPGD